MKVLVDLSKIQDLNCGLGQFCLYLKPELEKLGIKAMETLPKEKDCVGFDLYHAIHQDAKIPKKIPFILTIHDLNGLYERKGLKKFFYFLKLQAKLINKRLKGLSTISQCTLEDVERTFYIPKRVFKKVIYNGTNFSQISINKLSQQIVPSWFPINKYYFFIGTIHPKKNLELLLGLLPYLEKKDYYIVLAGNQLYPNPYSNQFKKWKRFILPGTVSLEEKELLFTHNNCLGMINPSRLEGFGLPLLEAMHRRTKVFCSDIPAFREIGRDFVTYFSPTNPIDISAFETSYQPLEEAYLYSNTFSWEKSAQNYVELYEKSL